MALNPPDEMRTSDAVLRIRLRNLGDIMPGPNAKSTTPARPRAAGPNTKSADAKSASAKSVRAKSASTKKTAAKTPVPGNSTSQLKAKTKPAAKPSVAGKQSAGRQPASGKTNASAKNPTKPISKEDKKKLKAVAEAKKLALKAEKKRARKEAAEKAAAAKAEKANAEKLKREKAKLAKKAKKAQRKLTEKQIKARGKGKAKVEFEGTMLREEAVAYFEAVVSGLKNGSIQFKQGKETLAVNPADKVEIALSAHIKGKRERVTFELSWAAKKPETISVSSG